MPQPTPMPMYMHSSSSSQLESSLDLLRARLEPLLREDLPWNKERIFDLWLLQDERINSRPSAKMIMESKTSKQRTRLEKLIAVQMENGDQRRSTDENEISKSYIRQSFYTNVGWRQQQLYWFSPFWWVADGCCSCTTCALVWNARVLTNDAQRIFWRQTKNDQVKQILTKLKFLFANFVVLPAMQLCHKVVIVRERFRHYHRIHIKF